MLKKTNERGITLISLVITIIILLILATVAINLAVDSEGLFTKAGGAANSWNTSVAEENEKLGNLIGTIEEMTREKTLVELYDAGQLKIGDYVAYNPIAAGETGEESKYTYTSTGEMTGMSGDEEEGTASINIVRITEPEVEVSVDQTFKVDANTKWRVLGVEGESSARHIVLISDEPIKNTEGSSDYYLKGAEGYEYGPTELNNISAIYGHGTGATGAVSVNADHVNKITGVTEENLATYDIIGTYGNKYSFNHTRTPKMWIDGVELGAVDITSSAYWYSGKAKGLETDATTNSKTGVKLYDMIFSDNYWLATQGIIVEPRVTPNAEAISFNDKNVNTTLLINSSETVVMPVARIWLKIPSFCLGNVLDGYVGFHIDRESNGEKEYITPLFEDEGDKAIEAERPGNVFTQSPAYENEGHSGIRPVVSLKPEATITMLK